MMLDELKVKAEAAKAWRPGGYCVLLDEGDDRTCTDEWPCHACLGAQRAAEDIAAAIDVALGRCRNPQEKGRHWVDELPPTHFAGIAARIASYFASEPNPVSIFMDAVKEMCK